MRANESRFSFDRFLPFVVGIVGIIVSLIFGPMSRDREFALIGVMFLIVGGISCWFAFGSTRFWIRYVVFAVVFFALPLLVAVLERPGSPNSYMFSAFGVMLVMLNYGLKICGIRIQKVVGYGKRSHIQTGFQADSSNQFTIRDLMQMTFFIAVTSAVFTVWDRAVSINWNTVTFFFSLRCVAFYVINSLSILTALPKRKLILWYILDVISLYLCTTTMFALPRSGPESFFALLFFNSLWLTTYSVPRIFGYRWTWHMPFKKRSRQEVKLDIPRVTPPTILTTPGDPPLPAHPPGLQQIAEPPVVVRQSSPPPLPNSDEH